MRRSSHSFWLSGRLRSVVLLIGLGSPLAAQQTALATPSTLVTTAELPNAPGRGDRFPSSDSSAQPKPQSGTALQPDAVPQGTGSITGVVLDIRGDAVPGARVTLVGRAGAAERSITADSAGEFTFGGVPSGTYKVTITSAGLATFVSSDIVLGTGERRTLPRISLPVATANTDVQVTVTQDEVAQEQVTAELHQRVFGVFPNFYSSYIWNAAPLPPRQKFKLAIRATTDPVVFVATGLIAGVQQARNTFPGYGQGAQGYAKRYGATYGDDFIGRMLGSAVLPIVLHQDPRYFYKGSGSKRSRAWYALSRALITRGDNGKWQPNYSRVIGVFAAGGIDNLYHPAGDRGAGLVISSGFLNIAGNAADNLLREFVLRDLTPTVPGYAKGKE